jgi:hypothetical protein
MRGLAVYVKAVMRDHRWLAFYEQNRTNITIVEDIGNTARVKFSINRR